MTQPHVELMLHAMGFLALACWIVVIWIERDHMRDHTPMPVEVRDAAMVTLLLVIGAGTSAFLADDLFGHDIGNLIRGIGRASALVGGIYALAGTR